MKYGESTFDVLYLLFAIVSGILILRRAKNKTERQMGLAALILGCGDAFHLVPRVLNYFAEADFTAALGIGKLVTSATMTVFYVLLYFVWLGYYREKENRSLTIAVWALALVRCALCLFPQNGWLENSSDMAWGIIRNVPFVILGAAVCYLYWKNREKDRTVRRGVLYIRLSEGARIRCLQFLLCLTARRRGSLHMLWAVCIFPGQEWHRLGGSRTPLPCWS